VVVAGDEVRAWRARLQRVTIERLHVFQAGS
jgi:hypothetical protein